MFYRVPVTRYESPVVGGRQTESKLFAGILQAERVCPLWPSCSIRCRISCTILIPPLLSSLSSTFPAPPTLAGAFAAEGVQRYGRNHRGAQPCSPAFRPGSARRQHFLHVR